MSPPSDRRALRTLLRERRRALPAAFRIAAAESLADRLLALPFMPATGHVAGYWAIDGEIGLHAWQVRIADTARTTACPCCMKTEGLRFAPWHPGDALVDQPLRHSRTRCAIRMALLEPEQMALVVLPLVGFDARCNRLGMGGGWYDRSFAFRQPAPRRHGWSAPHSTHS